MLHSGRFSADLQTLRNSAVISIPENTSNGIDYSGNDWKVQNTFSLMYIKAQLSGGGGGQRLRVRLKLIIKWEQ
jgi:hypothetical protein